MKKPIQKETISRKVVACIASATLTLSMIPISAIAFASTTELPEADTPATVQADTTQASGQDVTQPAGEGNTQPAATVDTGASDAGTGIDKGQTGIETGTDDGQGQEVTEADTFTLMNVEGEGEEVEAQALENAVAQVGENTYATLQDAITAVYYTDTKTATIELLGDTEEAQVIVWEGCNIALDLNGYTVTGSVVNYGDLIVKDTSTANTGTIVCHNGNALGNQSRTTIYGGTIKSMSTGMACVQNNGEMVIHGGSFYGNEPSGPAVTNNSAKGNLTIYGGFFSSKYTGNVNNGYSHAAIQTLNGAHTVIKDGTFIGQHTAAYVSGNGSYLTINGGTFEGTARSAVYYNQTDCNVYITDGTFVGGLAVIGGSINKSPGVKIVGGKFNKIVNGVVQEDKYDMSRFLVEGVVQLDDGTISDGNVAQVGDARYETLQAAVDAIEGSGTIIMVGDVKDMATADIVNIHEGKEIVLDMAGHSITVASDFAGRPIANKGTLTITGNGTIDSSNSKTGYGAVRNDGTLTITNGRYLGSVYGDGAAIRNGIGSNLTVDDGYFAATSAIYNVGEATLYKGEFVTLACSGCATPWAYALNNRNEGGVSGTMQILPASDADVVVHGPQGALAAAGGANVYVKGGTFYTHPCANNHSGSTFYALYVSGKADMVATCVIDGGIFSTTGANSCAYIENTNPDDNGGEPGKAIVRINGGSFDQGPASKLVNFSNKNGSMLEISGGEFKGKNIESVEPYVIPTMQLQDNGNDVYTVVPKEIVAQIGDVTYPTLEAAIEAAQDGDTVLLLKDVDTATVNKTVTIDLGGKTIKTIDVVGNGADKPGITATIYNGTVETADITNRGKILSNKVEVATVNAMNGRLETNGGTYGTVNVTAGGNVHINNGTFDTVTADGANYASIKNGTFGTVTINNTKTKSISGGTYETFATDLRSAVVAGKIVVKTKDGKFAVMNQSQVVATADGWGYMSLDDAIKAVKNGGTVELLKDNKVDTWNQIWDAKDVTINGNGKTLTVGKIESGVNGNFLLYRAQNLAVNDLNIELNNGSAFDMTGGSLDRVTVTGGKIAVSGASETTIKDCAFNGQSVMAIYTDDSQGAPGLVVDSCNFTNTRVGILRADEKITNCTITGSADWYQLTVVGTNAVISGNVFTGNDKALELYGQPTNITRNNLANAGEIYAGNDIDPLFTEVDLSKNYWGGSYLKDVAGITIESYYTDEAMTNLVTIETPGDDNPGNQGEQPTNPGTTNPGTTNAAQGGNAGTTIINRTVTLQPAAAADDEQPAEAIADDATPLASNAQAESEDIEDNDTPMASFDQGQFESDQAGLIDWTVVALSVAGLAVLGGLVFFLLARKRRKDEEAA